MTARNPHDVVCLTTALNPALAHMVEQALQQEGIKCKVVGDYLNAGIGDIPGLRAEIWVHRDDLAAAETVLRRSQTASAEDASDEAES